MTEEQGFEKEAMAHIAEWGKVGCDLFFEIARLKRLCGQASFCLRGPCQGVPGAVSLLADTLHEASVGVEIPALPEPTPKWVAEYGRRFCELYPGAVFDARLGAWSVPETLMMVKL